VERGGRTVRRCEKGLKSFEMSVVWIDIVKIKEDSKRVKGTSEYGFLPRGFVAIVILHKFVDLERKFLRKITVRKDHANTDMFRVRSGE
jgi:hypothetical protein